METRRKLYMHLDSLCADGGSSWISIFLGSSPKTAKSRLEQFIQTAGSVWSDAMDLSIRDRMLGRMRRAEAKILAQLSALRGQGSTVLYSSHDTMRVVPVPGLPRDLIVAGERPHVKPIFHILQKRQPFWMLQLDHGSSHIYRSDGFDLKHIQSYPPFHAKGEWDNALLRRMQRVMARRPAPALLAGSPTFAAIARLSMPKTDLMAETLHDVAGASSPEDLFERAMAIVEDHFDTLAEAKTQMFARAEIEGRTASEPEIIVRAFREDTLQHLFLAADCSIWGRVNWETSTVQLQGTQDAVHGNDILGLLAQRAYRQNIKFTLLPLQMMPDRKPMAAVLSQPKFEPSYRPATPLTLSTSAETQRWQTAISPA